MERASVLSEGLCYDTGGLNLKPSGSIETMYTDKHGACTVLGAMKAIVELQLPVNVLMCMACAENAIDADAQHPVWSATTVAQLTTHSMYSPAVSVCVWGSQFVSGLTVLTSLAAAVRHCDFLQGAHGPHRQHRRRRPAGVGGRHYLHPEALR